MLQKWRLADMKVFHGSDIRIEKVNMRTGEQWI
jgi:hypothetical protein